MHAGGIIDATADQTSCCRPRTAPEVFQDRQDEDVIDGVLDVGFALALAAEALKRGAGLEGREAVRPVAPVCSRASYPR